MPFARPETVQLLDPELDTVSVHVGPLGEGVTTYDVTAVPPSSTGGTQVTVA